MAQYGVIEKDGLKKISFPGGLIEAFQECSFSEPLHIASRIRAAEIIEGLPFDSLENTLYFKKMMGREKDVRDIQLIESYLISHPEATVPAGQTIETTVWNRA